MPKSNHILFLPGFSIRKTLQAAPLVIEATYNRKSKCPHCWWRPYFFYLEFYMAAIDVDFDFEVYKEITTLRRTKEMTALHQKQGECMSNTRRVF